MKYPAKWIFTVIGILAGATIVLTSLSPSVRFSIVTAIEVRTLLRFRDRFRAENFEATCPNYRLYQAGACVRDLLSEEDRLHFASMTARIYYLSTLVSATDLARENARTVQDQVEASLNFLEYLNEEMKVVLLKTGGQVDLSPLDSRTNTAGLIEDPEVPLRRRYYANLVDLWIKNWRRDEKTFAQSRASVDIRTGARIDVLRADRDELFSRFSIDLTRYEKKRLPAGEDEGSSEPKSVTAPLAAKKTEAPVPSATPTVVTPAEVKAPEPPPVVVIPSAPSPTTIAPPTGLTGPELVTNAKPDESEPVAEPPSDRLPAHEGPGSRMNSEPDPVPTSSPDT